jgi:hypothetical protein
MIGGYLSHQAYVNNLGTDAYPPLLLPGLIQQGMEVVWVVYQLEHDTDLCARPQSVRRKQLHGLVEVWWLRRRLPCIVSE